MKRPNFPQQVQLKDEILVYSANSFESQRCSSNCGPTLSDLSPTHPISFYFQNSAPPQQKKCQPGQNRTPKSYKTQPMLQIRTDSDEFQHEKSPRL